MAKLIRSYKVPRKKIVFNLVEDKDGEIFGPGYWKAFMELAESIPCELCRNESVNFIKFWHDLVNYKIGKEIKYKENFIKWKNEIDKVKYNETNKNKFEEISNKITGFFSGSKQENKIIKQDNKKENEIIEKVKYNPQPYSVSLKKYGHLKSLKDYPKIIREYEPNGKYENRTFEKWDNKNNKWVEIDSVEFNYYKVSVEDNVNYEYNRYKKIENGKKVYYLEKIK